MDAELPDHPLSSNHIMELDYTLDADMVSPDRFDCELQSDCDQFMASIQSTDPQEVEMTDDYSSAPFELDSCQKINVLAPITSELPINDFPTFIDSNLSTYGRDIINLPPSSTSDLTSSLSMGIENPVEIEPVHLPTFDSQAFSVQTSVPLVQPAEPVRASDEPKQLERDSAPILNDQNAAVTDETFEQASLSDVVSGTGSTSEAEPHVAPHQDEAHSIIQPTAEALSSLAQAEDGEQSVTVADEVPPDSLPLLPQLTTDVQTSIEEPIESLNTDEITAVDESLELHPRPRIDLLEHVRTEFEVLEIIDENTLDPQEQMIKQAPCIRLLCEDCEYNVFQRLSASNSSNDPNPESCPGEEPLLLGELADQAIYFAPLGDFIETLRQIFPDFTQTDHSELVLSFPDLEARIPEDNVYTRELSLFDIDRLHVGANLPSRLLVSLEKQPRLIHRFNVLAKHVWKQNLTEPLDAEQGDTEEDSCEDYEAEQAPEHVDLEDATITEGPLASVEEVLTVDEDTVGKAHDASSSAVHLDPPMISEGDVGSDLPVTPTNGSTEPIQLIDVSIPSNHNVAEHDNEEDDKNKHVQADCVVKDTCTSSSQSALRDSARSLHLDNSTPDSAECQDQHFDGMVKDFPKSVLTPVVQGHFVAENTLESDLRDDQTVDCDSPTDKTADGEELDSVEASEEALKNPTTGATPADKLEHPDELSVPHSNLNQEAAEPVTSKYHSVDDDELISNGTVLGCEGSDDDVEEITDARFDTIIDNSPLLNSVTSNSNDPAAVSLAKQPFISGVVSSADLSRSPNETKKRPVDYDNDACCTHQDENDGGSPQSERYLVRMISAPDSSRQYRCIPVVPAAIPPGL
ncbi:uncharacterized protein MELLADRAFT_116094 [Melampsora larici-populina 98AG31]|uniref:Uncharacterized protein n=1 Tax=Melampsora larici-populina (strain 98AG31 / pathotype 3-4-7) TaxID=747676 RepID=F4RHE0_MELLP|nr:uncharacterized protein MELLADRAFT_116094 [Melampsora larici-populina 98AG31]EGG08262.1 hypothetical protein MELLADRAFT_116094 [Melampsora larici-populina 98AG31]